MRFRRPHTLLGAASASIAALLGCSTEPVPYRDTLSAMDGSSGVLADAGSESSVIAGYPAPHAELPRVESFGGLVQGAPNVVPVFFADDPFQSQIEQFLMQLKSSSYWTATTGEYGVGTLAVAPSIVVSDSVPSTITSAQILAWLGGRLDGTHAEWPPIDSNNMYVIFYPQATTITETSGATTLGTSCKDFGAYHGQGFLNDGGGGDAGEAGDVEDGGVGGGGDAFDSNPDAAAGLFRPTGPSFVYAVIPRCTAFGDQSGLDAVTTSTSHEIVEAATDPFPGTSPAYGVVDFDHIVWDLALGGSELGDMCVGAESSDRIHRRLVGNFMVQRTWSNQAAGVSQDPCVPPIPDVYFGAAPEFDETVLVPYPSSDPNLPYLVTTGETILVGESRTITVRLFSTAPTSDWYVQAVELLPTSGASRALRFAWDKAGGVASQGVVTGHNGDVLKLTITRTAPASLGGTMFSIVSSPVTGSGGNTRWFGLVN